LIASSTQAPVFFSPAFAAEAGEAIGFRIHAGGIHTSRTMMLAELRSTLDGVPAEADRSAYWSAIVEENCTHKSTAATRKLTGLRLGELYALDPKVPMFRALRKVWDVSAEGQPLLAMLTALTRDRRLLTTASTIAALQEGEELQRDRMSAALRLADSDRLNASILDKVVRNTASSWSQAGHLVGRTFKKRHFVHATPAVASFAAYLASHAGLHGVEIFRSGWFQIIDASPAKARELLLEAKQIGLIDMRAAGDVITLSFDRLDAPEGRG
jgi:hypothetical protein